MWWCRGGGGRVRLRQAAAALGQTKTEKALGWAGLGWAGQGCTSGRAGPRLAGCAVTAWCWPLVAAGAPQKNNSQSARPATARTDRRTCCQALVTFPVITAPLRFRLMEHRILASSNQKFTCWKEKIFVVQFYPSTPLLCSLHNEIIYFSMLNQNDIKTCTPIIKPYLSGSWEDTNLGGPCNVLLLVPVSPQVSDVFPAAGCRRVLASVARAAGGWGPQHRLTHSAPPHRHQAPSICNTVQLNT